MKDSNEEKKNKIFNKLCKLKHFSITLSCFNRKSDYYINNYENFLSVDQAIDIAKEFKFYDKSNPRKIYKKSFNEKDDTSHLSIKKSDEINSFAFKIITDMKDYEGNPIVEKLDCEYLKNKVLK